MTIGLIKFDARYRVGKISLKNFFLYHDPIDT